jgi:hypothetical protein
MNHEKDISTTEDTEDTEDTEKEFLLDLSLSGASVVNMQALT